MPQEEQKPIVTQPTKSSMEILSELFGSFDAEPPLIIKKEKDESKKHKKSKKKHKHKEKKHRKKDKKRKRSDSCSSERSEMDLAELLIKQERQSPEKKLQVGEEPHLEQKTDEHSDDRRESAPKANIKGEKVGSDESPKKSQTKTKSKITIKNLKFSSVFEATIREVQEKEKREFMEEGELDLSSSCEDDDKRDRRKRKHKHCHHKEKSKRRKHSHHHKETCDKSDKEQRSKKSKESDFYKSSKYESRKQDKGDDHKHKDKCKEECCRSKDDYKTKEKLKSDYYSDKDYKLKSDYKDRESDSSRSRDDHCKYKMKHRDNVSSKEDGSKSKDEIFRSKDYDDKFATKDRYRAYGELEKERDRRYHERSSSCDRIDKKKLLEIARKNAIQMMKSGSLPAALTLGPQAQEKVLAAIKAGGKTVEELTDFCKTLSKKEELGELSGMSGDEDGDDSDLENRAFHHPFQIKDRPTSIVMNIKNSVPLPTKTAQERTAELRMQFPVSSGTQHRKTENEWVPVSPKKVEMPLVQIVPKTVVPTVTAATPIVETSSVATQLAVTPPGPQVFPSNSDLNIDIGSIVSQRLQAMRKLQENPYDVEALNEMHRSQKEMQTWAESKQQPGQFTGTTGANILSQAELAAGYQAWARKDQLQNAAPVSGGMGMHLLKKMGWNPGEGLGKEKTGALEPLLLEVKLDKKGLVANEEQKRRQQKAQRNAMKTLEGKHPVSLLGEYTAKRKLGAPQYTLCMESGPDHKKMFLFKVAVNGMEFQPEMASPNKKQAKADAAKLCLQKLGLLPP